MKRTPQTHSTYCEGLQDVCAQATASAPAQGVQQQEALQRVTVLHCVVDLVQNLHARDTLQSMCMEPAWADAMQGQA